MYYSLADDIGDDPRMTANLVLSSINSNARDL